MFMGNCSSAIARIVAGAHHTFDSFECAIQAIAPICEHCKVVKRNGVTRRAKLYYLRDRVGKATRLRERKGKGGETVSTKKAKADAAAAPTTEPKA